MNEKRRLLIGKAAAILVEVRDDEQIARDNLPPGPSEGAAGDNMDSAIQCLDSALGELDEIDGVELCY